jgi:UDP-glucose 4-epimerase
MVTNKDKNKKINMIKKVLVTGGAGFIGSHTVEALLEKGYKVFVLDNLSTGKIDNIKNEKLTFIKGDIQDFDLVKKIMKKVDAVIHLAAIASVAQSIDQPIQTHDVNVTGTLNVFLSAVENNIKKVVYASSAAIYGANENIPLLEQCEAKPISNYGAHKYINEIYAKLFNETSKTNFLILRYFNVYGPRQSLTGGYPAVIPNFCLKILNNENVKVFGDGKQYRDFIFVKDLAKINVLCLESDKIKESVLNVGTGISTDLNNLIKNLENITNIKAKVKKEKMRKGDVKKSLANIEQLSRKIRIKYTPLVEGLSETLEYYRNQKN